MTHDEYLVFHEDFCNRARRLSDVKNQDYTGGPEDAFANFRAPELLRVCSAETGFLVKLLDKFCRTATFVKTGILKVKSESVEDTLLDMVNYSILLAAFISSRREPQTQTSSKGGVKDATCTSKRTDSGCARS